MCTLSLFHERDIQQHMHVFLCETSYFGYKLKSLPNNAKPKKRQHRLTVCYILYLYEFQGLYYLHTSPIQVHGRLTSSRCVIDGRFVLKISGFGLRTMGDSETASKKTKDINPYRE